MDLDERVREALQKYSLPGFDTGDTNEILGIEFGGDGEGYRWTNAGDIIENDENKYYLKFKDPFKNAIIKNTRYPIEKLFNEGFHEYASHEERMRNEQKTLQRLHPSVRVPAPKNEELTNEDLTNTVSLTEYVENTNILSMVDNKKFLDNLEEAFTEYRKLHNNQEVHGDAWLGNIGVSEDGPIIFDFEFVTDDNMPFEHKVAKDVVGIINNTKGRTNYNDDTILETFHNGYGALSTSVKSFIHDDYERRLKSNIPNTIWTQAFTYPIWNTTQEESQELRKQLIKL